MSKKGKSMKSIFEQSWNNPLIEVTFGVSKFVKLTEVKAIQLENILSIFIREGVLKLDKSM